MLKSWIMRIAASIILIMILTIATWSFVYSGPDPRNIKYALWKAGLYKMDTDLAAFTMVRDPGRDKLVVGKTKEELQKRFGNLLTLEQVSQYYRNGYDLGWKGKDVLFIKNSPWMIVFDRDRATSLVLMKGY
jgi:hypothetical protein